jgi:uncharacterized membrane protein YgdD (TMEM256/DUF423 family)
MALMTRLLTLCAGLMGAAGVALAAYAAHAQSGGNLVTASQFLLFHAAPVLATGLAPPGRLRVIGGSLLVMGALLFCGDLTLRALSGTAPWPMAAPTGGMILILGWLVLALSAFARPSRAA